MNKYVLLCVLFAHATTGAFAQCNCSSSSSSISSSSVSYGETSNASVTMDERQWLVEAYGDYSNFEQDTDQTKTVMLQNTRTALLAARYGLSDRITLALQQSYMWLNATSQSSDGFGDLLFLSTVKVLDKNDFTGAFLAGAKFPTGTKSSVLNGVNLVIGSGSFDPLGGVLLVKSFSKSFIRANAFYKHGRTGYDKTNFGNFFSYNLTFSYKLKGTKESCASDSVKTENKNFSWSAFASTLGEWSSEQVKENKIVENTGRYSLFLQAGTLLGFSKWSIPVSFSIPLTQELKGEQSQILFRTRIGIIKTF